MKKLLSKAACLPSIIYFLISLYFYIDGCTCSGFVCDVGLWIVAWPWSIWWKDSYVIVDWDSFVWNILKESPFYRFVHFLPLLFFIILNTILLFFLGKMVVFSSRVMLNREHGLFHKR